MKRYSSECCMDIGCGLNQVLKDNKSTTDADRVGYSLGYMTNDGSNSSRYTFSRSFNYSNFLITSPIDASSFEENRFAHYIDKQNSANSSPSFTSNSTNTNSNYNDITTNEFNECGLYKYGLSFNSGRSHYTPDYRYTSGPNKESVDQQNNKYNCICNYNYSGITQYFDSFNSNFGLFKYKRIKVQENQSNCNNSSICKIDRDSGVNYKNDGKLFKAVVKCSSLTISRLLENLLDGISNTIGKEGASIIGDITFINVVFRDQNSGELGTFKVNSTSPVISNLLQGIFDGLSSIIPDVVSNIDHINVHFKNSTNFEDKLYGNNSQYSNNTNNNNKILSPIKKQIPQPTYQIQQPILKQPPQPTTNKQ